MLMRTRPIIMLLLSTLFTLHVGACSSQEAATEESIQTVGEEAPAEAPNDLEKTEADIEKDKALAEASGSDFTDPNEVQLNGDAVATTPVDPVDNTETPAGIDAPVAPDLMAADAGLGVESNAAVYFGKASSRVSREYREQLKELATKLKSDRSMKVTLTGHCDNRGSSAFNRRLAMKRARAVKSTLIKLGVKSKQMSLGSPQLAQTGETEEEHAQNRRVEVAFQ